MPIDNKRPVFDKLSTYAPRSVKAAHCVKKAVCNPTPQSMQLLQLTALHLHKTQLHTIHMQPTTYRPIDCFCSTMRNNAAISQRPHPPKHATIVIRKLGRGNLTLEHASSAGRVCDGAKAPWTSSLGSGLEHATGRHGHATRMQPSQQELPARAARLRALPARAPPARVPPAPTPCARKPPVRGAPVHDPRANARAKKRAEGTPLSPLLRRECAGHASARKQHAERVTGVGRLALAPLLVAPSRTCPLRSVPPRGATDERATRPKRTGVARACGAATDERARVEHQVQAVNDGSRHPLVVLRARARR